MSDDIVERLRTLVRRPEHRNEPLAAAVSEAADEIDRLRHRVASLKQGGDALAAELTRREREDHQLRDLCRRLAEVLGEHGYTNLSHHRSR